jgi:hypothetical protein
MRTVGIWISGLLASAIAGAIIGETLADVAEPEAPFAISGIVVGALAFTCLRLWLAGRRRFVTIQNETLPREAGDRAVPFSCARVSTGRPAPDRSEMTAVPLSWPKGMLMSRLAIIIAALLFSLSARAEEPTLSETLGWMNSTYNPHGSSLGYGRWETFAGYKLFQQRSTRFTYSGCAITFFTTGGVLAAYYQDSDSFKLNLGDIDPTSIHTKSYASVLAGLSCELVLPNSGKTCDIAEMTFETRNQALLIDSKYHHVLFPQLSGKDEHEINSNSKAYEASGLTRSLGAHD